MKLSGFCESISSNKNLALLHITRMLISVPEREDHLPLFMFIFMHYNRHQNIASRAEQTGSKDFKRSKCIILRYQTNPMPNKSSNKRNLVGFGRHKTVEKWIKWNKFLLK